jgi:hypothetical protein
LSISQDEEEKKLIDYLSRWLAPSGSLHPSGGFIDKNEQLILSIYEPTLDAIKRIIEYYKKNKGNIDMMEVNLILANALAKTPRSYLNYSGSIEGKRSKQITKGIASVKGGGEIPDEKRSLTDKLFRRNKEKDQIASD